MTRIKRCWRPQGGFLREFAHNQRDSGDADGSGEMAQPIRGRFVCALKDLALLGGTGSGTPRGTTRCATKWST